MNDEKIKEIHSIKNEINKINNIINNNIIFSPLNQKIKYKEDKNLETNSYNGTSECSQKTNIEKEIQMNSNSIPSIPSIDNSSNILLNKEQLYETFILFQKFLSASQSLNKEDNKENYNNLNKPLISAINNFKDIISNKEDIISNKEDIISNKNKINDININNKLNLKEDNVEIFDNISKEIKQFTLTSDKSIAENLCQNNQNTFCNSKNNIKNEGIREKNYSSNNIPYINRTNLNDSQNNNEINLKNNNKIISENETIKNLPKKSKKKKISNLFITSSKIRNESQESIKEFKDINCSKIKPKNKKQKDSSNNNKKNISNDYSFDFSNNNNMDSYSASMEDSIKIMTNDLCKNKNSKKNNKNNRLDSIKISSNQNHNKTSKSNEINKIIHNLNNDAIQSAREITRIKNKDSFIKSYKNKGEELIKNIKKIKVVKSKRENNNNNTKNNKNKDISCKNIEVNLNTNKNFKTNNNKEQIIEEKIKELNVETIKFREERDKVNKLKIEYEKLHEKLLKDIDNFNEKKEKFEKYRMDEINKIKEDKKNLDIQAKLITNIKMENQSLNNSIKSDKEIIDNLRNYINQLKSIIKKKDEEIKKLSQKNNNINNNYMINSYKTIGVSRDENNIKYKNINNKTKTFRNSIIRNNNSVERFERGYATNLSCSKIRNKNSYNGNEPKNNKNIINKSNSVVNIKNVLKMEARKGRNQTQTNEENNVERLNSFSGNFPYSQIKINYSNINTNNNNTSSKLQNLKIKLELLPKQTYDSKVKYVKKNYNRKISKTNLNTNNNINNNNNVLKNNENKKSTKNIINNNRYNNSIKISQELSKTSSNFMKPKKLNYKEDRNNKNNINKIDGQKQNKRSLSNDKLKLKLNKDLQKELNDPINKKEYDFNIPEKYSKINYKLIKKTKVEEKEIYLYSNNKKEIIFPNGLKKEIYSDGFQMVYFNNGDMKQIYPDGKNAYFFKDANTVQTTYPNGLEVFKFKNGQIEKHFPNGIKKIFFPNGAVDYLYDEKKEKDNFYTNNLKQLEI